MPISKLIWNMSLPIIASMLVQALYNIVDSVFVSRVSEQALTAVSLAFPAQNLMIGLATGTAVGVNALMGRALGAGQRERADKVANHGILLALVGFAISAVLGATCSDLFFRSQTQVESIILDIIPCHLLVEFYFRYLTWLECEAQKFTWQSVEDAHHTWESFEKAVPKEE
jgi:Na+-driven multidrug efflux pump